MSERVECAYCGGSMQREGGLYHQGLQYCGKCPLNEETVAAAKVRTPDEIVEACKALTVRVLRGLPKDASPGVPDEVLDAGIELEILLQEADRTPGGREWVMEHQGNIQRAMNEALVAKYPGLGTDLMLIGMMTEFLDMPTSPLAGDVANRKAKRGKKPHFRLA